MSEDIKKLFERKCKNCRFFQIRHGNAEMGECRHSPPVDGWPDVMALDWCGQFTPDIQEISA